MRTLCILCTVLTVRGKRHGCRLRTQHKVFVLEDEVQPPCFAQECVRLSDWGLFVGVAVHLQGRLRSRKCQSVDENRQAAERKVKLTSPYSLASQISMSGRRPPSCSLQRTTGCIVPTVPLKETKALGSRLADLVCMDGDKRQLSPPGRKMASVTAWISKPNLYPRDHAHEM